MKTKIKEVQDYFKSKMLSNEFTITHLDEFTINILIDNEYEFIVWIANIDIPEHCKLYTGGLSFMDIELTKDDAIKLNEILLKNVNKFRKEILLEQKRKEYERLLNELRDRV